MLYAAVKDFVDLTTKLIAVIGAVIAANFFLQAEVKIVAENMQASIREEEAEAEYRRRNEPMPEVVRMVIREYNQRNANDLLGKVNSTATDHSPAELCLTNRGAVVQVFPGANCDASPPTLGGRGRYYERRLLHLHMKDAGAVPLQTVVDAIQRIQVGEYLRGRCTSVNTGRARAENVEVRATAPFKPREMEKPRLDPGASAAAEFETDVFTPRDPQLSCTVTFDTGKGWVDQTLFRWVVAGVATLGVLALIGLVTRRSAATAD